MPGSAATRPLHLLTWLSLAALTIGSPAAESGLVRGGRLWVHDPSSIVRGAGEYWLFSTGMGVGSARSRDLVRWAGGPRVFEAKPSWVAGFLPEQRGHFWAPDVIRVRGRYLLYYSVSAWGRNTSAIGLGAASAPDPGQAGGHWTDEGIVVASARTNDFNAIDPCALLDGTGRLWLAFGSFWSGIKLVELDPGTGKRLSPDGPLHSLASHPEIEAPCLAEHGGQYYLFVNWGRCCRGIHSTYSIRVGRSRKIAGPYLDRKGNDMRRGGGSRFLETEGRFIGPGHAAVLRDGPHAWISFHFYDGERRGAATLGVRTLTWDAEGWPRAGAWVTPPPSAP
ncbi:MAG: arabinan endo-1,5-alpha-L-arabinosidase [Verrucomicrobia bacterium]|nr:arabinan endo-1,5-alpha-L-arabinosidase [Verrucomicrobiota bacterium]